MASNLTNAGQQYAIEAAFRGATQKSRFWLGLTNAALVKSSVMSGVEATEPTGEAAAPGAPIAALAGLGAGNLTNGVYSYKATFITPNGETQAGTVSANVTVVDNATNGQVNLTSIPLGSATVTQRKLYRTISGGGSWLFLATLADNTTTVYTDNIADGSLGAAAPSANSTGQKAPATTAPTTALAGTGAGLLGNGSYQYKVTFTSPAGETEAGPVSSAVVVTDYTTNGKVALSTIPLGGAGVTGRKLYRTVVAGTAFLLLATIANNTATTYEDNIADGSLGAAEPTVNTTAPNGYKRFYLPASAVTWITSALDSGDWQLGSDLYTWLAANAEGIGPVDYAFLCEDASQYTGLLLGFWQLSQVRTLSNTESLDVRIKIKQK